MMNQDFLNNEFANLDHSTKGLAVVIDEFLVDNANKQFTPTDLASMFDIPDTKLRSICRDVLGLGTKSKGKRYAASSNADYTLYVLPYAGEGSKNCYIAAKNNIDPRTLKEWPKQSAKSSSKTSK